MRPRRAVSPRWLALPAARFSPARLTQINYLATKIGVTFANTEQAAHAGRGQTVREVRADSTRGCERPLLWADETVKTAMKTEWPKNAANRREFLRGGLRYALLTAVGAVSATLASKPGAALPGQTCINQGICSGCNAFTDCGLPQALSAKAFQHGHSSSPTDEKSQRIAFLNRKSAGTFHPVAQRSDLT